jgi:Mg-chelatase subunit ChlD
MAANRRMLAALVAILLALAGCGEAADAELDRLDGVRPGPGGGAGGNSGMGAAGTSGAGGNDFGNMAMTPPPPAQELPPEETCVEGERCHDDNSVDEDDCGSQLLESDVETIEKPGNVLLVFDRSGSMAQEWNGDTRWEQAGLAIEQALTPLVEKLTIGMVGFPSSDPNAPLVCVDPTGIACLFVPGLMVAGGTCSVNAVSMPDQIPFTAGAEFLPLFVGPMGGAPMYAPVPGGRTPLREGLAQAQATLAAGVPEGITSVVVITDGDPNCEWDQAASTQIVADWLAQGIRTYVIGLPGTSGEGDAILTSLAMTGGTDQYITPNDAAALEMKLREIATETVQAGIDSCEIVLNPPAEAPEELHLVVTEGGNDADAPRDLGNGAGWSLSADASKVTLEGAFCDDALAGRFTSLRFEFGCVDLPELPPIEPPQ